MFLSHHPFSTHFASTSTFKYASRTGIRQGMLEIVIEEVSWSIRESYQTIRSSTLTDAKWHSVACPNTMTTLHRSDFIPIREPFTEVDLLPTYKSFPLNICDGCRILTGDAYSSGHLVPSNSGLAYVILVETNPFRELVVILSGLFTSNFPRYFLDFTC